MYISNKDILVLYEPLIPAGVQYQHFIIIGALGFLPSRSTYLSQKMLNYQIKQIDREVYAIRIHLSPGSCAVVVCIAINYTPISMAYYVYETYS